MPTLFCGQNASVKHHWVHRLRQRGRCKRCGKVSVLSAAVLVKMCPEAFSGSFPGLPELVRGSVQGDCYSGIFISFFAMPYLTVNNEGCCFDESGICSN